MARPTNPAVRTRILQEAETLIHLQGYHGTSLDDIARAMDMSKQNLLHHFGSKEDLALAVVDAKMADYFTQRVDPACCQEDPIEAVVRMFEASRKRFGANGCKAGCFVANIALEMSDLNDEFRKRAGAFFAEWTKRLGDCLAESQKSGYFAKTLEPRAAAESIISLYEGAVMLARAQRDPSVLDRAAKSARALLAQHKPQPRRNITMGPKTPCGC